VLFTLYFTCISMRSTNILLMSGNAAACACLPDFSIRGILP
jgi:hypothetical protein